jgi:hypothetical protein
MRQLAAMNKVKWITTEHQTRKQKKEKKHCCCWTPKSKKAPLLLLVMLLVFLLMLLLVLWKTSEQGRLVQQETRANLLLVMLSVVVGGSLARDLMQGQSPTGQQQQLLTPAELEADTVNVILTGVLTVAADGTGAETGVAKENEVGIGWGTERATVVV